MTHNCFWGFKRNENMVRQCLTACTHPKIEKVVTDEFCVMCPFRTMAGVSEKISAALAELRKSRQFRKVDFYTKYEMVVIMGENKFAVLEFEATGQNSKLLVHYFPSVKHTFEGCRIIFDPDVNKLAVAIIDKFSGAIIKQKEVK